MTRHGWNVPWLLWRGGTRTACKSSATWNVCFIVCITLCFSLRRVLSLSFFPNFFSSTSHFTIFIIFPTRRYVLCKLRYLCVTFWIIMVFEEIYVDIFLRSNRVNAYRNPPRRLWPLWSSLKMTWDLWRLCSDGPEMDRDLYWTLWTLARSRLWPRDAGRPELHKCSGYGRLEEGRMGRRSLVPISTAACTLK